VPEITLATVMSSKRLSCRVALFTTLPLPRVPVAPAPPMSSVPAESGGGAAVGVGTGQRRCAVPSLLSAPVPEMSLATVKALVRLNCRVALFTTLPVPSAPVVPAAPTLRMPAEDRRRARCRCWRPSSSSCRCRSG